MIVILSIYISSVEFFIDDIPSPFLHITRYKKYLTALLNEYGEYLDGFVWDESYYIQWPILGTTYAPGYAARGFMTLVQELTSIVHSHPACQGRECVFLTSDDLGPPTFWGNVPYAIVSDGLYQDTEFDPTYWPYTVIPNYR